MIMLSVLGYFYNYTKNNYHHAERSSPLPSCRAFWATLYLPNIKNHLIIYSNINYLYVFKSTIRNYTSIIALKIIIIIFYVLGGCIYDTPFLSIIFEFFY